MDFVFTVFLIIPVLGLLFFALSLLYFSYTGPLFVPTPKNISENTFSKIKINQGDLVVDLGCGDGRVLEYLAKKYQTKGLGVEINPFLYLIALVKSKLKKIKNVKYVRGDFLKTNLSAANIVYFYAIPKYLPGIIKKVDSECKKGTIVISQRFAVKDWENKMFFKEIRKSNSTFIYKI